MSQSDHITARGFQHNRSSFVDGYVSSASSMMSVTQAANRDEGCQDALDHLVRALLAKRIFEPFVILDELRERDLSLDTIVDLFIPRAACALGQEWKDDEISFADVTIGAMRLQALLDETMAQVDLDAALIDDRPQSLVVLPKGQQHFLGVNVIAAQLRRLGCGVSLSFDESMGYLNARLKDEHPQLILISCARRETLETVCETVQTIRATLSDSPVIALGGGVLDEAENLKDRTGVDIVTRSVKDALAFYAHHDQALTGL
ncbi:cobalamin-dependent protein [uncultured Roseobacter sp.]|uniref:cobalamin-dependent protein n=1 Tax=uncultured Roseobacter sp. TaxID=114847 RepID=UPI00261C403A|nr:cobalamin-dependent protein [uncultured Roseobacter sp.]